MFKSVCIYTNKCIWFLLVSYVTTSLMLKKQTEEKVFGSNWTVCSARPHKIKSWTVWPGFINVSCLLQCGCQDKAMWRGFDCSPEIRFRSPSSEKWDGAECWCRKPRWASHRDRSVSSLVFLLVLSVLIPASAEYMSCSSWPPHDNEVSSYFSNVVWIIWLRSA